jgi:hypothetical protein
VDAFGGVFAALAPSNGKNRDKKSMQKNKKTTGFFLFFFGKKLLTWTFRKDLFVVLLNSPWIVTYFLARAVVLVKNFTSIFLDFFWGR